MHMAPPASPPVDQVLTMERVLARPPDAPLRLDRPHHDNGLPMPASLQNKFPEVNALQGPANTATINSEDEGELPLPSTRLFPRRRLFANHNDDVHNDAIGPFARTGPRDRRGSQDDNESTGLPTFVDSPVSAALATNAQRQRINLEEDVDDDNEEEFRDEELGVVLRIRQRQTRLPVPPAHEDEPREPQVPVARPSPKWGRLQ